MTSLQKLVIGVASTIALLPIFSAEALTLKPLHTFSGGSDGGVPYAGVIDESGILYGTTYQGGGTGCSGAGCGVIFAYDTSTKTEKVLYKFAGGTDGSDPLGGLIEVSGVLYGTTTYGGSSSGSGCGTVFEYNLSTKKETVLYRFQCSSDGGFPQAGVIDVSGSLYGTTSTFGTGTLGTIFKVDISTKTETVLHSFPGGSDGSTPLAKLIAVSGTLYGTTYEGGTSGYGTLFSYNLSTKKEAIVYNFLGGNDGFLPDAAVIDKSGTLYGTTSGGGPSGQGTVFAFDLSSKKETVLYGFTGGADGGEPVGGVIDVSGSLYGSTTLGGSGCGCGSLYKVDISTKVETVLHSFDGTEGSAPAGDLTRVSGIIYGTTSAGGSGFGSLYEAH